MKHFQPQESGESLSRSHIFVACHSRFGGCTRTTTSLRTTSLLIHCVNSWFDQKTWFPRVVGPIHHVSCEDCGMDYIGETERSFKARFDEYKRPSSVNSEVSRHIHQENPGHSVSLTGSRILGVEQGWFQRGVKEAIVIHAMKPSLNRDGGRFNLSLIWHNIVGERIGKGARTLGPSSLVATSKRVYILSSSRIE